MGGRGPTRRGLLRRLGGLTVAAAGLGGYAGAVEPGLRLTVARWPLSPAGWPGAMRLRIAVVADLHACTPWMPASRIAGIVERTSALAPDLVLLLGDYRASHRFTSGAVGLDAVAAALSRLSAPLGVHAVLGNHDWWEDADAQATGHGPVAAARALEAAGIPVLENRAVRIGQGARGFWLAGLGSQIALLPGRGGRQAMAGVDDLAGTLAQVTDDAPVILLAHEPDIFPAVPDRVALTLSGHTHGGQVRLMGWSPVVPSRFGNRYAYGHVREGGRDLLVSGGLGCSILPVRFGMPPEITLVELGG